ncbi:MAG: hypothetical protein ACOC00_00090 [Halothiobacillaceae bacterium]
MRGIVTTEEIADALGIHRTTLHRITCSEDPGNELGDAIRRSAIPQLRGRYAYALLKKHLERIGIEVGDPEDTADYLAARVAELQDRVQRLESLVQP